MGVVMHHRIDVRPRFVDFAVDHALAIEAKFRRPHRLGIEIHLDEV